MSRLDGVIENPQNWPSIGDDATAAKIQTDLLSSCDAVLMGRRTYEGFAPVWPTRSGDPYSDRINSMPKYVVSTTLEKPDWHNTTVISEDIATEIAKIKNEPGQDIIQYGYGQLSATLLEHDLLDELHLWVHPLFVGGSNAHDLLFRESAAATFELADTRTLGNGIVILTYHPNRRRTV